MKNVVIVDYGLSNLLSVEHAFKYLGINPLITQNPQDIATADSIILPGVGAFADGMEGLASLGLIEPLVDRVKNGTPLMGICLGMQMLFDESEEFGLHKGLGFIPGRVVRIPDNDINGKKQKIPHISWNPLLPLECKNDFGDSILKSINIGDECYFIHSFEAKPQSTDFCLAETVYGGRRLCAVAQNKNVIGMQFHPEKSGMVGLKILRRFVEMYC